MLDATIPRARLSTVDLEQDVRRLVGDGSAAAALSIVAERKVAGSALSALIRGERLTGGEDTTGSCVLTAHTLRETMRLDNAAVRALTLLPPGRTGGARSAGGAADSVLSLFRSHALSAGGSQLLRRWLLQPLLDVRRIQMRQGAVSAILSDAELRDALKDALRVPDLQALARRLQRGSASLLDVCRLYQAVTALPGLAALLEEPARRGEEAEDAVAGSQVSAAASGAATCGGGSAMAAPPASAASSVGSGVVAKSLLGRLHARVLWCCSELEQFERMVDKVILDPTDPEPRVNPAWDDSLGEAAAAMEEAEADAQEALAAARRSWGAAIGVKLERDKTRGLLFRCPRKHDREVRGVPGVKIVSVLKDGVRFTTTTGGRGGGGLRGVAEAMSAAALDYQEKQKEVVSTAVDVVRTYCPVIEAAAAALSELDAVRAMACAAASAPLQYVRPQLVPLQWGADGSPGPVARVEVLGARHPVLEAQAAAGEAPEAVVAVGGGSGFVPNDYVLGTAAEGGGGDDDAGGSSASPGLLHIVTGPNMGGKSTYIRTLGTIAVMAQAGSFVPADRAVLPVFDSVQARVGAGDAQLRGVSTFMAEMLEAAAILETATPASLVIVDELGRGTSTYDGFGLAWAIAERLAASTRCVTLFATHFHELTALEESATVPPGSVKNLHVSAAVGIPSGSTQGEPARALTMLYRVQPGPCPASFGVHVAEIAGFPKHLVEAARAKAAELETLAKRGRAILTASSSASSASSSSPSAPATQSVKASGDVSQAGRLLAASLAAAGSAGDRTAVLAAAKRALEVYAAASDAKE